MITYTTTYSVTMEEKRCADCGIVYAAPQEWWREKERTAGSFTCPNGCRRKFAESEADRLRRRLDSTRSQLTHERDQREATERSLAAYKGHLTKLRKRIDQGVCPHCQRTFKNVMRHMSHKHPDKVEEARAAKAEAA